MRIAGALLILVPLVACSGAGDGPPDPSSAAGASALGGSPDVSAQERALVATARAAAAGKSPEGHCYAAVARYIDTVGYGKMRPQPADRVGSLPAIPDAYGAYAHQFADYVDAGHADELGLARLPLDDPYDAPPGAIVVVRAGTPGTAHPTAGDISVAAGNGVFYNDGEMSYHGRASFPPGNDFVLGIYVPKADGTRACASDHACNRGAGGTARVCSSSLGVCIDGCHADDDCPDGTACDRTGPHWSCR